MFIQCLKLMMPLSWIVFHIRCLLFLGIVSIPLIIADQAACIHTCNCVNMTESSYFKRGSEYRCGMQSEVLINVVRPLITGFEHLGLIDASGGVWFFCNGSNNPSYLNALKVIKPPLGSFWFRLKKCPLPKESFHEILKKFNLNWVKELFIELISNETTSLKPFYLEKTDSLEILHLQNSSIIELPASIFKDCVNLYELDLRWNLLHNLPANVYESLTNLQKLNLGFNNFTELNDDTFRYLPNLTVLDLDHNALNAISKFAFTPLDKLEMLDLSSNFLRRIEDGSFDSLTSLVSLNLNFNRLSQLPHNVFAKNRNLKIVRLVAAFSTEMNSLPSGLFTDLVKLSSVHIESNNFATVPNGLFDRCDDIRKVSLRHNSLQTLPTALFINTSIEEIDLSDNKLESLDEGIFSSMAMLRILNLSRNHLKKIHSDSFANLKSLAKLYMSENELIDFEVETFANLQNLDMVDLSHNKLTMERWLDVSPFNKCTRLGYLNLANNSLTKVFKDWRNKSTSLWRLDMSRNNLSKLTASDFMFASGSSVNFANNPLRTIDLSSLETLVKNPCQQYSCDQSSMKDERTPVEFYLENTPIKCDCGAFHLARYFQGKMPRVVEKFLTIIAKQVNCDWPDALKNISLGKVDLNKLTCPLSHNV